MKSLLRTWRCSVLIALVLLGAAQAVAAAPAAGGGGWEILGEHTVFYGETLYCLGRAYGVDPWAIATQNDIVTPNLIHPGMVLSIPNVPGTLPPGPVCAQQFGDLAPAQACGGCVCSATHTIQWGDTLTYISIRYSADMWSIAECNCIYNLDYIRAGDTLCIP